MKDDRDFADLLDCYLQRAGFTQQELANKINVHRNTLVKWLTRSSRPESREQVLRLADELFLNEEERKGFIQAAGFSLERWPTEVWLVPQQDPFFVGREDVFQSLQQLLVPGNVTALTQAISGLGGIGKTSTAIEYAYRFHQYYKAVLWLQADSWEILASGCLKLADELGLPEQKETDLVIAAVQRWLSKHHHWLLILDNVENPQEILPKFVPPRHQGCVLVTTRVQDVEPLAQTQKLSLMSEQEGILFLLRRTKRIPQKAGLEKASPEQYEDAKQIWQLMGGLPLALDQAGAYILETRCSFSSYQEQYTRRRAELLKRRGERFIGHNMSVATTFFLALERVEQINPMAADILRVCSLLQSDAIAEEIFLDGAVHLGPLLSANPDGWNEAIGVLNKYSLVQRNTDAKTLTMHRLVQAVLQDSLEETQRRTWTGRTILALNTVFPSVEYSTWLQCECLLPHAVLAAQYIRTMQIINEEAAHLLNETANYLRERARYTEAEPLFQQALQMRQQILISKQPDVAISNVATSYNDLGRLYARQGQYEQAALYFQNAQQCWEQALGSEHLQVASVLNNLAITQTRQGHYQEAEQNFQRALAIWEKLHRSEDPQAVNVLNGLANLYVEQGKFTQAKPLFLRTLAIWENEYGPDHPQVAVALNNLGMFYANQREFTQAKPLFLRALAIWENGYGPDHPQVAIVLNNLAALSIEEGKYDEAKSRYRRALDIREQTQGSTSSDLAIPLEGLAELHLKQGKYMEAEPYFLRSLGMWEQLNLEHPRSIRSLNGLAELYFKQGEYMKAEPYFLRSLNIQEKETGSEPKHPNMAETMCNFARLREVQGNSEEAKNLYAQALAIYEQALGIHHSKTMEVRTQLIALGSEVEQ